MSFENIKWIRKMIHEFEKRQSVDEEKKLFELRELKHALHFVGINPQTIVHKYWEVVSKDFMNQKILSNKSVNNADFKVSGYV